jgi:hypothetical protein
MKNINAVTVNTVGCNQLLEIEMKSPFVDRFNTLIVKPSVVIDSPGVIVESGAPLPALSEIILFKFDSA